MGLCLIQYGLLPKHTYHEMMQPMTNPKERMACCPSTPVHQDTCKDQPQMREDDLPQDNDGFSNNLKMAECQVWHEETSRPQSKGCWTICQNIHVT